MEKLKKHNELEVGKYYRIYDEDGKPYDIVTNLNIEISFWRHHCNIKDMGNTDVAHYLYREISAHSYNRIKRNVMHRLGLVENL